MRRGCSRRAPAQLSARPLQSPADAARAAVAPSPGTTPRRLRPTTKSPRARLPQKQLTGRRPTGDAAHRQMRPPARATGARLAALSAPLATPRHSASPPMPAPSSMATPIAPALLRASAEATLPDAGQAESAVRHRQHSRRGAAPRMRRDRAHGAVSGRARLKSRDEELGSGVWGLGSGVWGLGSGVWGLGSGVWGLGSGVRGPGSGVRGPGSGVRGSGGPGSGGPGVRGLGINPKAGHGAL